ncbi:MAG TPA: sulfate transporter CysZ [Candidatus Competibacteraceae bacterium]|nr:sulfate transporter CysZ [Candidatus Competibacteraceae bacterium]MCP5132948.1 sulfate transporter CysZ [Gammaproteobacteria bacterium]HPF58254.1 sulfate transporter CysZ [Candidatus Competibacteraceae bacterium]
MSASPIKGAGYVLTGLRWLPRSGLRSFVAIPLLINILLFGTGVWWSIGQFQHLNQIVQSWLPSWLSWLHWLLWPVFVLTVLVVVFYTFSVVANLIAAPFNGLLAERVEKLIHQADAPPSETRLRWKDLILSPLVELSKLLYFIGWAIPLLLLSLVPVINVVAPVLWVLFGAWMLALEYADYPLGNRGLSFREQRRLLRRHWPLTLGFGGMTLVLTLIPVFNFLAMPAAVIGATLMWVQETPE